MSINRLFDRARQESESRIDLVPILDMMVTLLIFFVVAASLGQQHMLKVDPAKSGHNEQVRDKHLLLALDSTGVVHYGAKQLTVPELLAEAQSWTQSHPGGKIILQADKNARVQSLVSIIDTLRGSGIQNVAMGVAGKAPAPTQMP